MYSLLIVDDEKWIRQGLAQAIDWAPLRITSVRQAENGEQALTLSAEFPPDVVITDIRMNGMGGLPLCEELRQRHPDVQLILISGYRDFSFAQQAIRLGVSDYLLKPIDEGALLRTVRQCLFRVEKQRTQSMLEQIEPAPRRALPEQQHPTVRAVTQQIERYYATRITLSSEARRMNMNGSYLSKLFRDETSQTFTQYLARVRVRHAGEMLNDPSMKIYQVAESVGYPDVKHFVSVFKELTGLTPTEWRQKGEG